MGKIIVINPEIINEAGASRLSRFRIVFSTTFLATFNGSISAFSINY